VLISSNHHVALKLRHVADAIAPDLVQGAIALVALRSSADQRPGVSFVALCAGGL